MAEFCQFAKNVNTTSREDMIQFLQNHFRYGTLHSWNRMTSYANNIKINNLNVSPAVKDAMYDMLDVDAVYSIAKSVLTDFRNRYDGHYCIGCNGRSGGYLVLYSGEKTVSQYKSICTNCGQWNYQPVTNGNCRCGKCGQDTRVNIESTMYDYSVSFKSIDQDEDFDERSDEELKDRVELVQDFDQTCDAYIAAIIDIVDQFAVAEETVMVPETVKILKRKEEKTDGNIQSD